MFVAPVINVALALALLFALLGGLAHVFWLWSGVAAWRWISYVHGLQLLSPSWFIIPVSGLLPIPVGLAIALFLVAGGLVYVLYSVRGTAQDLKGRLAGEGWPEVSVTGQAPNTEGVAGTELPTRSAGVASTQLSEGLLRALTSRWLQIPFCPANSRSRWPGPVRSPVRG